MWISVILVWVEALVVKVNFCSQDLAPDRTRPKNISQAFFLAWRASLFYLTTEIKNIIPTVFQVCVAASIKFSNDLYASLAYKMLIFPLVKLVK